jgi:hypothetical protein
MTNTKHTQSTRTTIALGAAAGLAVVASFAVRVGDQSLPSGAGTATESHAIAVWARNEGLTGLSPASLRFAPRSTTDLEASIQSERLAIADWARTHGLSGLSPASLAPRG